MARSWLDFPLKTGSDCALLGGRALSLPFAAGVISTAVQKMVPGVSEAAFLTWIFNVDLMWAF